MKTIHNESYLESENGMECLPSHLHPFPCLFTSFAKTIVLSSFLQSISLFG